MKNKEPIDPKLVEEFVNESHGNLDRVRQLLELEPALVNASWDWGKGDWETGLGAAAHMGKKDIALHLLERGARLDLFAAAMFNRLEIVKAILTNYPEAKNFPGPHGISLMSHAKKGKAADVVAYLNGVYSQPQLDKAAE